MKYYLIAGEASGDLHGGNLMRGLLAVDSDARFRYWGASCMEAVAGTKVRDCSQTAVMGFADVLRKLGSIAANLRFCKKDIAEWRPDVVILIDYPGFNMRMARFCHKRGIRVFYYIAPKTWASREGRNRKLKAWVDRLFVIFPFEVPYFTSKGIHVIYKGNPLVDAVEEHGFRYPLEESGRYIAILPGSRKSEITHTMPNAMAMADTLHALPQYADYQFIVAAAPTIDIQVYARFVKDRPYVRVMSGRTRDILEYAEAALINSGTASLEAALIGTPQVVCWSTQPLTYWIARNVLRVQNHIKFISLANLILDKEVFRELIQRDFTSQAAASELRRLMEDIPCRNRMEADYAEIRKHLGCTGASLAIARAMFEEIKPYQ